MTKKENQIHIASTVDFPLGAGDKAQKVALAKLAKKAGASELDVVMSIGKFLGGQYDEVLDELKAVAKILPTKVIVESGYLLDDGLLLKSAELVEKSGAEFWKTSTGMFKNLDVPEKFRQIKLIRRHFPNLKIKIAGGIRTHEDVMRAMECGANIAGSSAGVQICEAHPDAAQYIDHTILFSDVAQKDIERICAEASKYRFRAVCVNQTWVALCKKNLQK